jgi:hypothetical protein
VAQRIAAQEADAPIRQPSDLQVIAVFPGHVRLVLERPNFRMPA